MAATVQGTELINIESYTKYFNFIDEVPVCCWKKRISKQNISKVLVSQWRVTELKKVDRDTRQLQNAWFPYDRCRSFTITGIASKLFSDRSDHMETKFSFLLAITNDPSDWSISAIVKDRQRSQRLNGKHQCSNYSDCNDPSDHTEIKVQGLQRS